MRLLVVDAEGRGKGFAQGARSPRPCRRLGLSRAFRIRSGVNNVKYLYRISFHAFEAWFGAGVLPMTRAAVSGRNVGGRLPGMGQAANVPGIGAASPLAGLFASGRGGRNDPAPGRRREKAGARARTRRLADAVLYPAPEG